MSATIGKVYVDAVITDERYKECMSLVQEADKRIDELRELLRVAITYCVNGYCGKDDGCPLRLTDYDCQLLTKARELGVEVEP